MPRRSKTYRSPRDWVSSGTWPDGTFHHDAPEDVAVAVAIAKALEDALEGRNRTQVAGDAEIERSTLYDILQGRTWPDTVTLAKLERELNRGLWPTFPTEPLDRATTANEPDSRSSHAPDSGEDTARRTGG